LDVNAEVLCAGEHAQAAQEGVSEPQNDAVLLSVEYADLHLAAEALLNAAAFWRKACAEAEDQQHAQHCTSRSSRLEALAESMFHIIQTR
jgi:hypothetical protein